MSADSGNPFGLKMEGTIVNTPPISYEEALRRLKMKEHLLDEATKLIERMQDELGGARRRLVEQEGELRSLREELNKPSGE